MNAPSVPQPHEPSQQKKRYHKPHIERRDPPTPPPFKRALKKPKSWSDTGYLAIDPYQDEVEEIVKTLLWAVDRDMPVIFVENLDRWIQQTNNSGRGRFKADEWARDKHYNEGLSVDEILGEWLERRKRETGRGVKNPLNSLRDILKRKPRKTQ